MKLFQLNSFLLQKEMLHLIYSGELTHIPCPYTPERFSKVQKSKARAPRDCFFTVTIPGHDYHIPKAKSIRCPTEALKPTQASQANSRRCCSWLTSPSASRTPPYNPFSSLELHLPTSSSLVCSKQFQLKHHVTTTFLLYGHSSLYSWSGDPFQPGRAWRENELSNSFSKHMSNESSASPLYLNKYVTFIHMCATQILINWFVLISQVEKGSRYVFIFIILKNLSS